MTYVNVSPVFGESCFTVYTMIGFQYEEVYFGFKENQNAVSTIKDRALCSTVREVKEIMGENCIKTYGF